MSIKDKIEVVKGIVDSIYVYLSLLEEDEVKYRVQSTYTGHSLYCKLSQATTWNNIVEYHLEYSTIGDVLKLEIHHPNNRNSKIYLRCVKENLQHKCQPETQHLKTLNIYMFKYKFDDINLVNSLAEVMIAVAKSKQL